MNDDKLMRIVSPESKLLLFIIINKTIVKTKACMRGSFVPSSQDIGLLEHVSAAYT